MYWHVKKTVPLAFSVFMQTVLLLICCLCLLGLSLHHRNVYCLPPRLRLALKCGSKKGLGMAAWGRGCSSKATREDRLAAIWHTVKDPRNLHSDCVPVGLTELCSLVMLLLAPIPKLASALLMELEGCQWVHCGNLPSPHSLLALPSTYSSIYADCPGHVYSHSRDWKPPPHVSRALPVSQSFICLRFLHRSEEESLALSKCRSLL